MYGNTINIPGRILAGIRREAVVASPAECCGALVGLVTPSGWDIRTLIPLVNEASSDARFLIDAAAVMRLDRQAECAGLSLLGFYHSHPSGSALPSATDLDLACGGFLYIITEPLRGDVRAWRLRDDRSGFDELRIAASVAGAA